MTMRRVVGVLAVLVALAAAPVSAAESWAKHADRDCGDGRAHGSVGGRVPAGRPARPWRAARARRGARRRDGDAGRPIRPGKAARARRGPRPRARPRPCREARPRRAGSCGPGAAGPRRNRGRGAAARPPHEPSAGPGSNRAPSGRCRHPRRDRVLAGTRPRAPGHRRRCGARGAGRRDRPSAAHRLAAAGPAARRALRRLPVHLGRLLGPPAGAVRRDGARRLRLLRPRLARLQARAFRRRAGACRGVRGPARRMR